MLLLQRIAHTGMARSKHLVALARVAGGIKLQVHQLIHVAQHQHVAVQLHHAVVLFKREGRQLAPAVVEARVVGEVLLNLGQQVVDMLLGDAALVEGTMAFGGKGVGVEGNEGVFGAVLLEAVVEGEQAGEVGRVSNEGCPHCVLVSVRVCRERMAKAWSSYLSSIAPQSPLCCCSMLSYLPGPTHGHTVCSTSAMMNTQEQSDQTETHTVATR